MVFTQSVAPHNMCAIKDIMIYLYDILWVYF